MDRVRNEYIEGTGQAESFGDKDREARQSRNSEYVEQYEVWSY